jgi:RNA polymerase sigma-70 factor, ECF subfamily
MISARAAGQWTSMNATLVVDHGAQGMCAQDEASAEVRLALLFEEHYDFVWRTFRRLGLDVGDADDGAQQVFVVASRRLGEIRVGGERPYLFGIAFRVAADLRKRSSRRHEQPSEDVGDTRDPAPQPDEMLDQRRARELLDAALERLPMELRLVFTMHEVEEMSMSEIADVLGIAAGTVASRLRRARQDFETIVTRLTRLPRGGAR